MFFYNRDSADRLARLPAFDWMTSLTPLRTVPPTSTSVVDKTCGCTKTVLSKIATADHYKAVAAHPAFDSDIQRLKQQLKEDLVVVAIGGRQQVL